MPQIDFDEVFQNGVKLSSTPRTVTDAERRARNAEQRLRAGRTQLRTIRDSAQAAANSTTTLTLAQLTSQFRQVCAGFGVLVQTLMDIELITAWQQDDGQD